jgi:DNA-binding NarL/FixJ family response regulator
VTTSPPVPAAFAPYLPPALAEVNVPAYVLDRNGLVCWVNAAAIAVTGDTVGKHVSAVVDIDEREARRIFEHNIAGAEPRDRTFFVRRADGGRTRVDVSSVRLTDRHQAIGMFGIAIPEHRLPRPRATTHPLTKRQHQILEMLADGASTAVIAERLVLSQQTVRNHIRQILQRMHCHTRLAAVAAARRDGLIA